MPSSAGYDDLNSICAFFQASLAMRTLFVGIVGIAVGSSLSMLLASVNDKKDIEPCNCQCHCAATSPAVNPSAVATSPDPYDEFLVQARSLATPAAPDSSKGWNFPGSPAATALSAKVGSIISRQEGVVH
jgi:hypothetical protein